MQRQYKTNVLGYRVMPKDTPATRGMKNNCRIKIPKSYREQLKPIIEAANTLGELESIVLFGRAKIKAIKAAEELGYDAQCMTALKESTSVGQIEHIMIDARHRFFD